MSKAIYTAQATVVGGRDGHGCSNDGALDVQLRTPPELGGKGDGTNPEQLFAVGYAACFLGALGAVARRARADVGTPKIDSKVNLVALPDRTFAISVELAVTLPTINDPEEAARIVADAHKVCPYSNATRGNIAIILTANGQPLEHVGAGNDR
jgi:Ohr subfamily peroxiredoxin